MQFAQISKSTKAIWTIAVVSLALFFVLGRWHRGKVIDADVISYYSYLPAVVVHGDITMNYAPGNDFFADKVWGVTWKEGFGPVQKYTMGLSWLYAPFFLAGHGTALLLGFEADGYSAPYTFWLQLSAIFYLVLGMVWLRKVLRTYFSDGITALTLLALAFGTNLYYYSHGQAAMPHVYLFALISGLLWFTIQFYANPSWRNVLILGLIASLITLVRPNHILMWAIPMGFGLTSVATIRERFRFWKRHFPKLLLFPLVQAIILTPQILYWNLMTDHWIYYSYGDESFFWTDPQVLKVWFSYRNGWLVYTPLMALGVAGLLLLRKYARDFSIVVPFVFALGTYVISCWWCWWYGGSFGQRVFIDFYPMLALGFAGMLTQIQSFLHSKVTKSVALAIFTLMIGLNIFQTFQYGRGVIHYDSMTARAYWNAFGRDRRSPTQAQELEAPDYEAAKRGIR
jgi:hypothetical protein